MNDDLKRIADIARAIQEDADEILKPVYNPFAKKLERYKSYLANAEARVEHARANDMPGTYVTGASGVPASRMRKLDRQIERTVELAGKYVYWKRKVDELQAKHDAYAKGEINAQGRRISARPKPNHKLPVFATLDERIFCYQGMTGTIWCDKRVLDKDDYKPIAHVSDENHKETWYSGNFPPELLDEVKRRVELHKQNHVAYCDR